MTSKFKYSGIMKKQSMKFLLPLLFIALFIGSTTTFNSMNSFESIPQPYNLSLTPNTAKLPVEVDPGDNNIAPGFNGFGSITVHNLDFKGDISGDEEPTFSTVPGCTYEYTTDPNIIGVVENASTRTAEQIVDSFYSYIVILIEDHVTWEYDDTVTEWQIGFGPYLQPATLNQITVNSTIIDETHYETQGGIFFYDFEDNFTSSDTGSLEIIYTYEYSIPVSQWNVENVIGDEDTYITETEQVVTQDYTYAVTVGAMGLDLPLSGRVNITLPDADKIHNLELDLYDNQSWDLVDNIIVDNMVSFKIDLNTSKTLSLNFSAEFNVKFTDVIEDFWAEDKIVEGFDTRERNYYISVIDGPSELVLKNLKFNDTSIYYPETDRIFSIKSSLERPVYMLNMNKSTGSETPEYLATNVFVDGITLLGYLGDTGYYLSTGELDIITIRYETELELKILVTDKIQTPLSNYKVNLYVGEVLYGPKMSFEDTNPLATQKTNDGGLINVGFVPRINYTAQVLDTLGREIGVFTVSPTEELNMLVTSVTHFPATIFGFSSVSVLFILAGIFIFKRNE